MAETELRPHLILPEQFTNSRSFAPYADPGKNKRRNLHRNHQLHGKALQEKLASIQEEYEREEARRLSMSMVDEDFIYVEFISDQAVSLDIDRLDSSRGIYVLCELTVKKEGQERCGNLAEDMNNQPLG